MSPNLKRILQFFEIDIFVNAKPLGLIIKKIYRSFCNKRPGAMHFSKGGATITDK